jgi:signal transduction histidine kinase
VRPTRRERRLTYADPVIAAQVRPSPGDLLLAGSFTAFAVIEGLTTGAQVGLRSGAVEDLGLYLLIMVPAMVALAWRRIWPIPVAAIVVLANMVTNVDGSGASTFAVIVAAYSVGAHAVQRRAFLVLPVSLALGLVLSDPTLDGTLAPSDLAAVMIFLLAPWALGRFVRDRDDAAQAAGERAHLLEREHAALVAAATAEERVRLARELHDVVSHSISVVCIQTQAVRHRLHPDQEREAADLQAVETTAREAMAELRRLFGVLRGDTDVPLAPQPGLDQLENLAQTVRRTGLHVDVTGTPVDPLPPGLDLTAYRVVQEALTNAVKHSEASRVEVNVTQSSAGLDIQVDDDGVGLRDGTAGHGLNGIAERAELYGGHVEIGQSPSGGVRVAAHLPWRGEP